MEDARLALTELGRLHAPVIGSDTFAEADWLNRESPMNQALITQLYAAFIDRYGEAITPTSGWCQRLVDNFDAYWLRRPRLVSLRPGARRPPAGQYAVWPAWLCAT